MAKKKRFYNPDVVEDTQDAIRRFNEYEPEDDKEQPDVINSLDDLAEYEDYPEEDLQDYEYHATGDTGRGKR